MKLNATIILTFFSIHTNWPKFFFGNQNWIVVINQRFLKNASVFIMCPQPGRQTKKSNQHRKHKKNRLTKIVLQKFYKILWSQVASFGLANWTKKVFPLFPRNIPYRERLKSPLSVFFGIVRFFRKFFFHQIFFTVQFFDVLQYFNVLQQWMLKNAKGYLF